MATYSPTFGNVYTFINDKSTERKHIARKLNSQSMADDRELLVTLLGTVAGSAANILRKRIQHSITELGGVRVIEDINAPNRNTTAADITDLVDNILSYNSQPTYVIDVATTGV